MPLICIARAHYEMSEVKFREKQIHQIIQNLENETSDFDEMPVIILGNCAPELVQKGSRSLPTFIVRLLRKIQIYKP